MLRDGPMQVEEELAQFSPEKDTVLTIGVFDGVHLGHRYLISQLVERARKEGLLSGVITFRQHPREVLFHRTRLPFLTTLAQRTALLKNEGIDIVIPLSFNLELAQISARQFTGLLKKYLRMRGLIIGPDFALGRKREGDFDTLRKLGQEMGFSVTAIQPITANGDVVSSTAIRKALENGDMKRVLKLLGRHFSLQGRVVTGAGRGAGVVGFPTANLDVDPKQALPSEGVYATWAYLNNQKYQSMTNIGRAPTFGENERTVEVFLLNYKNNLYERELRIEIAERLRDEKRFDSVEELKKQIAEDVKQGTAILNARSRE
jgi:riboflavin kinase/FMN adenylyltransferase